MSTQIIKALANDRRLQIMEWLKKPASHFEPQDVGDLEKDGVCGSQLAEKLGITHATLSVHMDILLDAGLVRAKRIQKWTFFKRNESQITAFKKHILSQL